MNQKDPMKARMVTNEDGTVTVQGGRWTLDQGNGKVLQGFGFSFTTQKPAKPVYDTPERDPVFRLGDKVE